jgi:nicotinamide phosphoribosyltransferase
VIRPDSGNPATVVGKVLEILDQRFGSTTNSKGYKVLQHVRVIQGDGINEQSLVEILETVAKRGFSVTNVAFGMGGALLQKLNRDTQKFAVKCSQVVVHGEELSVYKDPVTDPGKRSKKGRLDLIKTEGTYQTVAETEETMALSKLETVYENGFLTKEYSFDEVRNQAMI